MAMAEAMAGTMAEAETMAETMAEAMTVAMAMARSSSTPTTRFLAEVLTKREARRALNKRVIAVSRRLRRCMLFL